MAPRRCLRVTALTISQSVVAARWSLLRRGQWVQEGSAFSGFPVTNAGFFVFLSWPSIDPPEGGEWRPEQQDSEDH